MTDGGLPFPDDWFAVVSMRFISPWIPDYARLIDETRRYVIHLLVLPVMRLN